MPRSRVQKRRARAGSSAGNSIRESDDGGTAPQRYEKREARPIPGPRGRPRMRRVSSLERAAGLAYRAAGAPGERAVLLVHGYPESSYMWRHVLGALGDAGWWALAPDLPGYGDSEPDAPGTWERHVEALERFVRELGIGPLALVTHDWGVMIGLRWACEHPDSVAALVISDGGFFVDRRWHDLANAMRTPGEGEQLISSITREGFFAAMRNRSSGMTE